MLWVALAAAETLVTPAKILEVTERGMILQVGTEPLAVEDSAETRWWKGMAGVRRDAFKKDELVHVRLKTDSDPPLAREVADPQTWKWLETVRKSPRKGVVERLDAKFLTLKLLDGGGTFAYRFTAKTEIRFQKKPGATTADVSLGMVVWVKGRLLPTLDTWAEWISDTPPPEPKSKPDAGASPKSKPKPLAASGTLTGMVKAVLPTYRMIDIEESGRLLHLTVTSSTTLLVNGKPGKIDQVRPGQKLTASYKRDANGRILAVRIDCSD